MKIPQLEDGYTRINNPTFEAWISYPMIPPTVRCQMLIARQSWGFHRATADLRPRDFVKHCKISHKNIHKVLKRAMSQGLFYTVRADGILGARYKLNKRFDEWFIPSRQTVPSGQTVNTVPPDGKYIYKESIKEKEHTNPDPFERNPKKPNAEWAYKIKVDMPPNFCLTDRMREYAKSKKIEDDRLDSVFEYFCTYHGSNGNKFKDWGMAWQSWCQNDLRFKDKPKAEDAFDRVRRKYAKDKPTSNSGELPKQTPEG